MTRDTNGCMVFNANTRSRAAAEEYVIIDFGNGILVQCPRQLTNFLEASISAGVMDRVPEIICVLGGKTRGT